MVIKIIKDLTTKAELQKIAKGGFGNLVKVAVDADREIMAVGGELHADEEALLIEQGSKQENIWGINLYLEKAADEWIEFNSMINVRPSQGNRSRSVEDPALQERIRVIINKLVV